MELRRERLFSVGTGLPAVVWWVLLIGAALNIALTYLFSVERLGAHLLLTLALTVFVALLIFLIAAMDHPFRGSSRSAPTPSGRCTGRCWPPDPESPVPAPPEAADPVARPLPSSPAAAEHFSRRTEVKPKKTIRRFDVFAEYRKQEQQEKGDSERVASGHGLWGWPRWSPAGASGPPAPAVRVPPAERESRAPRAPSGREIGTCWTGSLRPTLFKKEIMQRMGEEFYREVFVPEIRAAREEEVVRGDPGQLAQDLEQLTPAVTAGGCR